MPATQSSAAAMQTDLVLAAAGFPTVQPGLQGLGMLLPSPGRAVGAGLLARYTRTQRVPRQQGQLGPQHLHVPPG